MLATTRTALLAAMLLATGGLGPVHAQDRPAFSAEDGVSSNVIRTEGYRLQLSDGTEVRVTDVIPGDRPNVDCMVHVPSLTRRIEQGLRGGQLEPIGTAAQSVSLQVRQDPTTGELWCGGAGTGCTIIIQ